MAITRGARVWRWVALFTVIINVAFNYLYNTLPAAGKNVGEVANSYNSLFTPAGYAFSIWGAIYLSFIIYAIYQLLPAQKNDAAYDRLAAPFIIANMLAMAWIVAFSNNRIGYSLIIIAAMLLCAILMFGRSKDSYWYGYGQIPFSITIPFSLFAGWISVATIANISILLLSLKFNGGLIGASSWAIVMLSVATLLGLIISITFRDFIFPIVISWASIAIWMANRYTSSTVATVALTLGSILAVWSAVYAFRIFRKKQDERYNMHADA